MPTWDTGQETFDSGGITWDNDQGSPTIVGTQSDFVNRLQQLMPQGWFTPGEWPVLSGMLTGTANALSAIFALFGYVRNQTRIKTATDGFLDLIAWDFFRDKLYRVTGQTDDSFRARILSGLFRETCTRNAVIKVLTQLTGYAPVVIEPGRPLDTGVYDGPYLGYDAAGSYGDNLPYQSFVTAFRPLGSGVANVDGYDNPVGAYDTASQIEYTDPSMTNGTNDDDLYAGVESVRPAAYVIWLRISAAPIAS